MATFNEDVEIVEHALTLEDALGAELARLDADGNLVIRRSALGALVDVLSFVGKTGELTVGSSANGGRVALLTPAGEAIVLRGGDATAVVGVEGKEGHVKVCDTAGVDVVHLDGANANVTIGATGREGDVIVRDADGADALRLDAGSATVHVGADGNGGHVRVHDATGASVVHLDGASAKLTLGAEGKEGDLAILDAAGAKTLSFSANTARLTMGTIPNPGRISVVGTVGQNVLDFNGDSATLVVGAANTAGKLRIHDQFSRSTIGIDAVDNGDGTSQGSLIVGNEQCEGRIHVRDSRGQNVLHFHADDGVLIVGGQGTEGDIFVRDDTDTDRIHLNGADGDIILTGADLAEDFETAASQPALDPGTVVVAIGADEIATACDAIDRRVVGVVSGAGAFRPALRLGSKPGARRVPIAIAGRAYCKADATHGPIQRGDLLTTSTTPGYAQRVDDATAATGAILGKALEPLLEDTGLIPVLLVLG